MMTLRLLFYVVALLFAVLFHLGDTYHWNLDRWFPPSSVHQKHAKPAATTNGDVDGSIYVTNFQRGKQSLLAIYKTEPRVDVYCGCNFDAAGKIDWVSCGFKPRANAERAKRMEWEHFVPAAFFGHTRSCWSNGGRKGCERTDQVFNNFEGDMHNLRPAVGEVNGDRSDRIHSIVATKSKYGQCDFRIGLDAQGIPAAEPRDQAKGVVSRAWLFMADKHHFDIPEPYHSLYVGWAKKFPVTQDEVRMNDRIKAVQGDSNHYVDGTKAL